VPEPEVRITVMLWTALCRDYYYGDRCETPNYGFFVSSCGAEDDQRPNNLVRRLGWPNLGVEHELTGDTLTQLRLGGKPPSLRNPLP
jgi:hypothetical protein